MRKPYLDIIISFQKENIKDFGEFGFKLASEFFEKTIVWIIGLSSGTIVLIFKELNKQNKSQTILFEPITIKWTLIFLITSIAFGIIGRILYAIAIYIGYASLSKFSLLVNEIGLPQKARQLQGNETSEYIYLLLQEDFNIDLPIILENKKNADRDKKGFEDSNARKLYDDYAALALSKIKNGLILSKKLRDSVFMKKRGKRLCKIMWIRKSIIWLKRSIFPTKGVIWRSFTWLSFILYNISALAFVSAIIYYVVRYYIHLK